MRKLLLISTLLLFSTNGLADVKELICTDVTEEKLNVFNNITNNVEAAEECKSKPYRIKYVFVFDTDDLSNEYASAERTKYFCFNSPNHGITGSMIIKSTPNIISFMRNGETRFNVDRKTLEAGIGTDRDMQCTIKNLDMLENVF